MLTWKAAGTGTEAQCGFQLCCPLQQSAPSSLPLSFSLISHLVWVRDWSLLPLASPWGSRAHRIGRSGDSGSAEGKEL